MGHLGPSMGLISKLGFKVYTTSLQKHYDITTMGISSGVEAEQRSKERRCF